MGKKLAIKGHPTRGKEVIELFKMMGARHFVLDGTTEWYAINDLDNSITFHDNNYINCHEFVKFTLEEFLEKYPFKVGDKVFDIADRDPGIITIMKWDEDVSDMKYRVDFDTGDMGWYTNDTIGFLKEEKNMNKKLVIKGHLTRGKEVIKLLEILGGHNGSNLLANKSDYVYFITDSGDIDCKYPNYILTDYFTLEEFLEKYPFKVGDKVLISEYESEVRICKMRWDPLCEYVEYMVYRNDDPEWYTAEELLNWNDNPNETTDCKKCGLNFGSVQCFDKDCPNNTPKDTEEKKINQMSLANCDLDEVEIVLGDKFELKTKDGKYYAVRKKPKYPTTYKECCEIINACPTVSISYDSNEDMLYNDEVDLTLLALRKLIICRNVYWKVAGEEMGLDEPWKPDWDNLSTKRQFVILNNGRFTYSSRLLVFPTAEMQDVFYENFKDLIEQCKELL